MKAVVKTIYEFSDRVVVPSALGSHLLENQFHVNGDKAIVVPQGVQSVPARVATTFAKRQLGLAGKIVIASYGLINLTRALSTF